VKFGKPESIGRFAAALIRLIGGTLRITIEDRAGVSDPDKKQSMIWAFWHNRMFVIPLLRKRCAMHRNGAVLTSASRDGAIVASAMEAFGLRAVRGSSSRRGAAALRELADLLANGEDIAVAPDGPRGPRYKAGAGVVFLARKTGAAILPIRVEYSRAWKLKSWDRFMIPVPFSSVRIICEELLLIMPEDEIAEAEARLENALGQGPE
jgi:lysophospholipid acyltransferase (LPLAT)-like uncharacterized protein